MAHGDWVWVCTCGAHIRPGPGLPGDDPIYAHMADHEETLAQARTRMRRRVAADHDHSTGSTTTASVRGAVDESGYRRRGRGAHVCNRES